MLSVHHGESLVEELKEIEIAISVNVSALVLFSYDYLLNLSNEVSFMWHGPFRVATVFYIITRYLPFVGLIFEISNINASMDFLDDSLRAQHELHICTLGLHFIDALNILTRSAMTVVLVAQTYAIYNQHLLIASTLGCLGLATVVLDGFDAAVDTCSFDPPNTRAPLKTTDLVTQTVFSTAILFLTLYKVFDLFRTKKAVRNYVRSTLTSVILFETLCLSGVCVLRLFNVLLFFFAPTAFNLGAVPFELPVAATFISQFLLSLRTVNDQLPTERTLTKSLVLTSVLDCRHVPLSIIDYNHSGDVASISSITTTPRSDEPLFSCS